MSAPAPVARPRLDGLDLVRGLAMVVMLLDHMRDNVGPGAFWGPDPLDDATTTPLLYLTRWVTHLCAPTFVLLAGTSAGLQALRGTPRAALARYLATRGLWLVLLELLVVRPLVQFELDLSLLAYLQVIWALGASMLVLAALVYLPMRVVGLVGLALVLGHNALDGVPVASWSGPGSQVPSPADRAWMLLHHGGAFPLLEGPGLVVVVRYPVLPWLGVLACGYGSAELFEWAPGRRRRALVTAALAMLGLFLVLRLSQLYGDPIPWGPRPTALRTAMAFLNVQKYGPSLQYLLATLPWPLLLLAWLEGRDLSRGPAGALVVYGRVPLFYYLLQWPLAHLLGIGVTWALGKPVDAYFLNDLQASALPAVPDVGGPLWAVYPCWLAAVALLYWPCRWYAGVKARRKDLVLLRYL